MDTPGAMSRTAALHRQALARMERAQALRADLQVRMVELLAAIDGPVPWIELAHHTVVLWIPILTEAVGRLEDLSDWDSPADPDRSRLLAKEAVGAVIRGAAQQAHEAGDQAVARADWLLDFTRRGITHVGLTIARDRRACEADYDGYARIPLAAIAGQEGPNIQFPPMAGGAVQIVTGVAYFDGPDPGRYPIDHLDLSSMTVNVGTTPAIVFSHVRTYGEDVYGEEDDPC